ncbi:MAG: hypothetical protein IT368_02615 [Candidatus Hydrogenedentes bacterium]|nr:hypothetical protein [Candidatus Hydrogenedentota bacterium]
MIGTMTAVMLIGLGNASCSLPDERAGTALHLDTIHGYVAEASGDSLIDRYAPVILVEDFQNTYNHIGMPSARYDADGDEQIYVDPDKPVYYTRTVEWDGEHGHYKNLIYRVHFEKSISNRNSTDGGEGDNVGMMVIVTLNDQDLPIMVNAVHTCGCFHALFPTTFTPEEDYPKGWDKQEQDVWGEKVPGILAYPEGFAEDVRPVLYLRDGSHRVADMQVASIGSVRDRYPLDTAAVKPVENLQHLPLGNGETSFFYESGKNKGLVKSAFKRKESLMLGLVVGDTRVGQDRMYGSEAEVPRGFYTTINPFKKNASDMWDYKAFLEENGWTL